MDTPDGSPVLRIGELSRRLGVSAHVLRAWESRYGLLQPVRSAGGFRLYSEADELRVRRMQAHLTHGLSAAEAARAVLGAGGAAGADAGRAAGPYRAPPTAGELSSALRQALDAFDEPAAEAVLYRLLSGLSRPAVLRDFALPYLAELGQRWERGGPAADRRPGHRGPECCAAAVKVLVGGAAGSWAAERHATSAMIASISACET